MKTLIIYFDDTKKNFQVVKPTDKFIGDWSKLVSHITKGNYHSFEVI